MNYLLHSPTGILATLVGYYMFSSAAGAMLPPDPGQERTRYGYLLRFSTCHRAPCRDGLARSHAVWSLQAARQSLDEYLTWKEPTHRWNWGFNLARGSCLVALSGAFAGNEAQLHELARSVIDEDQQGAGICPVLEPAVLAAIDLDQFAVALPPKSRLMEAPALLPREPQALSHHPLTDGLPTHLDPMALMQRLSGKGRAEVAIVPAHQFQRILPYPGFQMVVRLPAASLVDQCTTAPIPVPDHQPVHLPLADRQYRRR